MKKGFKVTIYIAAALLVAAIVMYYVRRNNGDDGGSDGSEKQPSLERETIEKLMYEPAYMN
jgi:ABC-type cobalt transport system substrate-binding protein